MAFLSGDFSWGDSVLTSNPNNLLELINKSIRNDVLEWIEPIKTDERKLNSLFTIGVKSNDNTDLEMCISIVCVNVGPKYSMDYVINLREMIVKNLPLDIELKFYCITDRQDELPTGFIPLLADPNLPGWWQKVRLFDYSIGLTGKIVYFDLDIVITSEISRLIESDGIIKDWHYDSYNSSVMVWTAGNHREVWEKFSYSLVNRPPSGYAGPIWTDQDWIYIVGGWNTFPDGWCVSYKSHALNGVPKSSMVVVFHGNPKPHEVADSWVPKIGNNDFVSV